ncbi:MAG: serine/threonine-protein kinase [Myxococcota bacterium]
MTHFTASAHVMMDETPGDSSEQSTGAASRPRGAPAAVLSRGMSLGRYVVLEPLGHGGMGVVYAAFDPQLDRKVALKLVRPDVRYGALEDRRSRLLKEAQVLARLSHPNVVAVHDVGTFSDQVFIAMEFMAGGSLTNWLKQPRAWREVLERFLEAGEGLAVAHRLGIVHRDFKPDNVMLDGTGVAHVTDFGLAWTQDSTAPRHGGTGGYMAPEQRERQAVSAASDQFSFCVSLHRALAGEPPFIPAEDVKGGPRPFPAGNPTPQWIRRALARGLAAEPTQRFPSMEALLLALKDDPAAQRRRALATSGVVLSLVGALGAPAYFALRETPRQRAQRECVEAVQREAADLWGPERVAAMHQAFSTADPQRGPDTFARVEPRVAPEVRAWAQAASAQCAVDTSTSAARALDGCLASRRRVLHSLVDLFHHPDAEVLDNAVTTVALEMSPVASCRSTPAPLPPPEAVEEDTDAPSAERRLSSEELQALLGTARVMRAAGKYPEAISDALRCAALAEEAHQGQLQAEAQLLAGLLFSDLRRLDAEDALRKAITVSEAAGADEERARAWVALAGWYAQRNKLQEAREASQQAEAVVLRLGRPDLLEAERLTQLGTLYSYGGEREKAREAFDAALALRKRHLPDDHPLVLSALANRAGQLPRSPDDDEVAEAVGDLQTVLATSIRVFGEAHPQTALAEYQLGRALLIAGDYDAALQQLSRAAQSSEGQVESDPVRVGRVHTALSRAFSALGRWQEAVREGERGAQLLVDGSAPDEEVEAEVRRLLSFCEANPCHPDQSTRLKQMWEALGH